MRDVQRQKMNRELIAAVVIAVVWALVGMGLSRAKGADAPIGRSIENIRLLQAAQAPTASEAACRVYNHLAGGAANVGSGTLVQVSNDRRAGLVLTCAHLLSEGVGRVIVEFPDGRRHGALVVAVDHQADLSALEILSPRAAAVPLGSLPAAGEPVGACGFGPEGEYRCVAGRIVGSATRPGQLSVRVSGEVRSGDSGGGLFDEQGRLVGVVWGAAAGETYASTGAPLQAFLDQVLKRQSIPPRQSVSMAQCPNGMCPLLKPPVFLAPAKTVPGPGRGPWDSSGCYVFLWLP